MNSSLGWQLVKKAISVLDGHKESVFFAFFLASIQSVYELFWSSFYVFEDRIRISIRAQNRPV